MGFFFHVLFFGIPTILANHMPLPKIAFTGNISKFIPVTEFIKPWRGDENRRET